MAIVWMFQVAHIAPAEEDGTILGEPIEQEGCIAYPATELGLCISSTNALYKTTTEVYPDSDCSSAEQCILAQVAAIQGGLDFVLSLEEQEK